MPGKVLLDTNAVIAYFSGEKSIARRLDEAEVLVSSTVLRELYYGARKSGHVTANLAKIEQFATAIRVLSCDAGTAQYYGQIRDQLRVKGRPIPESDIWIAAVAMQFGLPVATRDDHFKEVDGLIVESW